MINAMYPGLHELWIHISLDSAHHSGPVQPELTACIQTRSCSLPVAGLRCLLSRVPAALQPACWASLLHLPQAHDV